MHFIVRKNPLSVLEMNYNEEAEKSISQAHEIAESKLLKIKVKTVNIFF